MAKKTLTLVREHPALVAGETRDDLERVYAEDENHKRYPIKEKGAEEVVSETLIAYPNEAEFEIVETNE